MYLLHFRLIKIDEDVDLPELQGRVLRFRFESPFLGVDGVVSSYQEEVRLLKYWRQTFGIRGVVHERLGVVDDGGQHGLRVIARRNALQEHPLRKSTIRSQVIFSESAESRIDVHTGLETAPSTAGCCNSCVAICCTRKASSSRTYSLGGGVLQSKHDTKPLPRLFD